MQVDEKRRIEKDELVTQAIVFSTLKGVISDLKYCLAYLGTNGPVLGGCDTPISQLSHIVVNWYCIK